MKNKKRLLASIMALAIAFAFAGCGTDKKSVDGNEEKIKEARGVVENFAEAFSAYDTEGMKSSIHGEDATEFLSDLEEEFAELGSSFVSETNGAISEDKANEYVDKIMGKIFSSVEMEVGEGKTNGDKVEFSVKTQIPDFESIDMSELQNPDDEVMMKILGIDMNDPSTIEELETLSPEKIMDRAMEGMIDWVIERIENVDTVEENGKVTVEKIGGSWKITEID